MFEGNTVANNVEAISRALVELNDTAVIECLKIIEEALKSLVNLSKNTINIILDDNDVIITSVDELHEAIGNQADG